MFDSRFRYVVAVASAGSFTAAARAVGVTQSAVTKSIADLEREIGYSVFYRTSRGVILTERGRDFVDRASRLLEDAKDLINGPAQPDDPYAGTLCIGVGPASLEWQLLDPISDLLKKHPGIRYDVRSAHVETVVQQLRSGVVDVAIGFDAAFSEWPGLRLSPMGSLEGVPFVRKGHPLLEQNDITVDDLASQDLIAPSESRPYGETIRKIYETRGIDWQLRVHRIDSFPMVRRIVATSDAIGIVARAYAEMKQFKQSFVVLPCDNPFPTAPLCCAVRARWEPKPAARAFIRTITRTMPPG